MSDIEVKPEVVIKSLMDILAVKPVPKSQKKVSIARPRPGISLKSTKVFLNRDDSFDRAKFLKTVSRITKRGKTERLISEPKKLISIIEEEKQDLVQEAQKLEENSNSNVSSVSSVSSSDSNDNSNVSSVSSVPSSETNDNNNNNNNNNDEKSFIKLGKSKMRRLKDVPDSQIILDVKEIPMRVGEQVLPIKMKASSYYMNNREIFINFINSLFDPYRDAILDDSQDISCDSKGSGKFALLTHQEIVRDYISLYSPYRGLLLYHGLGAGKTCASIAIAEGLKHSKEILVLTPASLQQNYKNELRTCGDSLYKLNQHWDWIPVGGNLEIIETLSNILSISVEDIRKQGGAWFVDIRKPSNFKDGLSTEQKISLNKQIEKMIASKYTFRNYNGWRKSDLEKPDFSDGGRYNPFDNKVVIIDEAHNFVSKIVNKLKKPDSMSMKIYEYLKNASNCRIVFLTGTPIINYPNEIAVLFNMLRGNIKVLNFYVDIGSARQINNDKIKKILKPLGIADYIEYSPTSKIIKITRNPFEFVSEYDKKTYGGVSKIKPPGVCSKNQDCGKGFICNKEINSCVSMTDIEFENEIKRLLQKEASIEIKEVKYEIFSALPDNLEKFSNMFIDNKNKFSEFKNENLFQRRIVGLTSYFRSAREELMPKYDKLDADGNLKDLSIEEIPMSSYQFVIYEAARADERSQDKRNAKKMAKKKPGDDLFGDSSSTYRIFSRAFCNYVFPEEIGRPMPQKDQKIKDFVENKADEDILDIVKLDEKMANVDGKYEADDISKLEDKDSSYENRIVSALEALKNNSKKYLSPEALERYGPKFLSIYNNITDPKNVGLHLLYSQFRTMEGIGIFSLVLEANGFIKFKVKKDRGNWIIDMPDEDIGKPAFGLFTGTENTEEKEIIRKIYNGQWDDIPINIAKKLREKADNNTMGNIIKVFMITSSGAEGITLKNCRFVHIMEPYWHPVRTEQVIGRARRICSHQELPADLRTLNVFMYLMIFTAEQMLSVAKGGVASKDLLQKDVSKVDKTTPFTSDQALFEIATLKENIINQILNAVKSSAIDCSLHSKSSDKESIVCMSFGDPPSSKFTTTPALTINKEFDKHRKRNLKKITWKAITITIGKKQYALKQKYPRAKDIKNKVGEYYDLDTYKQAQKNNKVRPILKGRLVLEKGKIKQKKI